MGEVKHFSKFTGNVAMTSSFMCRTNAPIDRHKRKRPNSERIFIYD